MLLGNNFLVAEGIDAGRQLAEGVKCLRQAADAGHTKAAFNLAVLFRDGRGVERSHAEAFRLFKAGSYKSNISSISQLKHCFGVEWDDLSGHREPAAQGAR